MNVTKCVFVYFSHVCMCTCSYYTVIYIYMYDVRLHMCNTLYTPNQDTQTHVYIHSGGYYIYIYYSHDMTKQKS